jgi:hypothetical protein
MWSPLKPAAEAGFFCLSPKFDTGGIDNIDTRRIVRVVTSLFPRKDSAMSISQLRTALYLFSRFLGDVRAVQSGRIVQRIGNRLVGHMIGKITRPLWFR